MVKRSGEGGLSKKADDSELRLHHERARRGDEERLVATMRKIRLVEIDSLGRPCAHIANATRGRLVGGELEE